MVEASSRLAASNSALVLAALLALLAAALFLATLDLQSDFVTLAFATFDSRSAFGAVAHFFGRDGVVFFSEEQELDREVDRFCFFKSVCHLKNKM